MSDTPETDKIAESLLYERAEKRDYELRQHSRRLERERDSTQEQLDAAIMIGKMQERRHERELEQVREQYRLSSVCRQLKEENDKLKQQQP